MLTRRSAALSNKNAGKSTNGKVKDSAAATSVGETTTVKKASEVTSNVEETIGDAPENVIAKGGKKDDVQQNIESLAVANVVEPETPDVKVESEESVTVSGSQRKKVVDSVEEVVVSAEPKVPGKENEVEKGRNIVELVMESYRGQQKEAAGVPKSEVGPNSKVEEESVFEDESSMDIEPEVVEKSALEKKHNSLNDSGPPATIEVDNPAPEVVEFSSGSSDPGHQSADQTTNRNSEKIAIGASGFWDYLNSRYPRTSLPRPPSPSDETLDEINIRFEHELIELRRLNIEAAKQCELEKEYRVRKLIDEFENRKKKMISDFGARIRELMGRRDCDIARQQRLAAARQVNLPASSGHSLPTMKSHLIRVKNVGLKYAEQRLREVFGRVGKLEFVTLVEGVTEAIIKFEKIEDAQTAYSTLNGVDFYGSKWDVTLM